MESRAKFLGHPIHQQLIVFPLGLLGMAVIFDLISFGTKNSHWTDMAFYMIGAGILTGLLAAIFGLIDWVAIPKNTRAKSVGAWHASFNVLVLLLFAASLVIRNSISGHLPNTLSFSCATGGLLLGGVSGWLGGELVNRLGIGVSPGADVNARSSLSGPAQ